MTTPVQAYVNGEPDANILSYDDWMAAKEPAPVSMK